MTTPSLLGTENRFDISQDALKERMAALSTCQIRQKEREHRRILVRMHDVKLHTVQPLVFVRNCS